MANQLLTVGMVTREALRLLVNNLVFASKVNREYDDRFAQDGAKIGEVLNIRLPVRYVNTMGQGIQIQDATEESVPVAMNLQYQRAFSFGSSQLALSIDDFSKRFIKPAISSIANQIDYDGLQLWKQVYQVVGTPGTVPNALLTYLLAGVQLDDAATPMDDERCIIMNPLMQATIVDALKGLFQASGAIAEQYRKGKMGTTGGFDWYMDQNIGTATVGPLGGTPLANSATVQTGSNIITDGWTSGNALRLNMGDVITFGTLGASNAVDMVNPQNRQDVGKLQQFVVTADCKDVSGAITIPISPAIVTTGPKQNVTQGVVDNAPVTVWGTANKISPQGLAFHRDAFTFVNADLPLPEYGWRDRASSKYAGLSIRVIRLYDINFDRYPCRLDLLGGWATLYPQLCCRIAS